MAKEKKLVEAITSMEDDFAQWYTDVVKKAELCAYSSLKGCMILLPAGYAIWENIQKELDARFKETGVENVYMPMFIQESLLQKEKDHVEGFAPEVAWVTQALLFVGKKQHVLFYVLQNFYGRKVILHTQQKKKQKNVL